MLRYSVAAPAGRAEAPSFADRTSSPKALPEHRHGSKHPAQRFLKAKSFGKLPLPFARPQARDDFINYLFEIQPRRAIARLDR